MDYNRSVGWLRHSTIVVTNLKSSDLPALGTGYSTCELVSVGFQHWTNCLVSLERVKMYVKMMGGKRH